MPIQLARPAVVLALVALACEAPKRSEEVAPSPAREVVASTLAAGTGSIQLEQVARIGELDGAPEYAFGQVTAIAARPDGSFFVCDQQDVRIRRYGPNGEFLGGIGRKGDGPGEYRHCGQMSLVGDSLLWVADAGNGRFTAFHMDGRSPRVVRLPERTNPQHVDGSGRFWWLRLDRSRAAQYIDAQTYIVTDQTGRVLDSVGVPAHRYAPTNRAFALSTNDGGYVSVPRDTLWSLAPDGSLLIALPKSYTVARIARWARPLVFTRTTEPVAYAADEHAEWVRWREYVDRQAAREREPTSHAPIPMTKPFVRAIRGDDAGRIWVQVHVPAEKRPIPPRAAGDPRPLLTWRERPTWELFESESGAFIGRVSLAYATYLMASSADRVWLVTEGPSGEQVIEIHQMRAARPPG